MTGLGALNNNGRLAHRTSSSMRHYLRGLRRAWSSALGEWSLRTVVLTLGGVLVLANLALLLFLSGPGSTDHHPTGGPAPGTDTHLSSAPLPLLQNDPVVAQGHGAQLMKNRFDRSKGFLERLKQQQAAEQQQQQTLQMDVAPPAPVIEEAVQSEEEQPPVAVDDDTIPEQPLDAPEPTPSEDVPSPSRSGDGTVHFLTPDTFAGEVLTQTNVDLVMVEFFAPWCGHCKRLAPEWAAAATNAVGHSVQFTAVDAIEYKAFAMQHGVRSYPTIKAFHRGADPENPVIYKAGRTRGEILEWVVRELQTASDANTKAKREQEAELQRAAQRAGEILAAKRAEKKRQREEGAAAAAGAAAVAGVGVDAGAGADGGGFMPVGTKRPRFNPAEIAARAAVWQRSPRRGMTEAFCDAQFGNGFLPSLSFCAAEPSSSYASDISSLSCQANPVTGAGMCTGSNLVLDVGRINVSKGGEAIEQVLGREEGAEFPKYAPETFKLRCAQNNYGGPAAFNAQNLPFHLEAQMKAVGFDDPFAPASASASSACEGRWIEAPTLFLTRYEYANLYHSLGDIYNALQAAMMHPDFAEALLRERRPAGSIMGGFGSGAGVHVVFMDGHSAGAIDDMWSRLFEKVSYVMRLSEAYGADSSAPPGLGQGKFCFRRAVFVSPAYKAAISVDMMSGNSLEPASASVLANAAAAAALAATSPSAPLVQIPCTRHAVMDDFARIVMERYEVDSLNPFEAFPAGTTQGQDEFGQDIFPSSVDLSVMPLVVMVLRKDYRAHPRLQVLTASRKVANEPALGEMFRGAAKWHTAAEASATAGGEGAATTEGQQLQSAASTAFGHGVHAVAVDFAKLTLLQQLLLVRHATVFAGLHGAGLSAALFLSPGASVLEVSPPEYQSRPHFRHFAQWASRNYVAMGASSDTGNGAGHVVDVHEMESLLRALTAPHTQGANGEMIAPHVPKSFIEGLREHFIVVPSSGYIAARAAEALSPASAPVAAVPDSPAPTSASPGVYEPEPDRPEGQPWTAGLLDDPIALPPKSSPPLPELQPTVSREVVDENAPSGQPEHRLCVVVPIRDSASPTSQGANRTRNLMELIPHLIKHLDLARPADFDETTPLPPGRTPGLKFVRDFEFIVVEQTQGVVFNKGALFNIGYLNARAAGCDYMVLHDVDQVPLSLANTYRAYDFATNPSARPVHLCSASSQYGFAMAYGTMVGGALLISLEQFALLNGYSNFYFGWGQEDDDFYYRISRTIGQPARLGAQEGRYQALSHLRVKDLDVTKVFSKGTQHLRETQVGTFDIQTDGLSNLRYRTRAIERFPQWPQGVRKIVVDLAFDDMPTDLNH